jgi:hypothetical protein
MQSRLFETLKSFELPLAEALILPHRIVNYSVISTQGEISKSLQQGLLKTAFQFLQLFIFDFSTINSLKPSSRARFVSAFAAVYLSWPKHGLPRASAPEI